ncbi:ABC transporter-like protein [Gloeomargarita lithophora Alchichica-D10]|uniref:ABC transporter-like protein n=1 Tax=Gloeomargarita lithophora Alchichica-D10 TaxID=1188229 RepID=A0A1J0A9T8_9CYAN|nr:ABC transporter ATP-binding protein [Gloeomargarita lithophora]APB32704.1 ABC transporter-like protein [Gloeomargarita lithophora Alchichica-D10]
MAGVILEQVTQRFGRHLAVADVSLRIPNGEFWVLMGPSGCGKSTILRTVAGLMPVQQGRVFLGERCVNQVSARERDVAMVFQNYALYPHLSVAENLAFGLKMRGVGSAVRQQRVQWVADLLGLTGLLTQKPGQLSGGQQQRVALGRAMVRSPQVFLMDEPLSNLDSRLRDQTRTELKRLHQQLKITTLYVTHDQTEAMTLADQLVIMHQGRVQQAGTPQNLYQHPDNKTVASFLGNPPMNFLPPWLLPNAPGEVTVGIRPEAIEITAPETGMLRGRVAVVEPLGDVTLVQVQIEATELWVKTQSVPVLGEWVGLIIPRQFCYYFDSANGIRLTTKYSNPI